MLNHSLLLKTKGLTNPRSSSPSVKEDGRNLTKQDSTDGFERAKTREFDVEVGTKSNFASKLRIDDHVGPLAVLLSPRVAGCYRTCF
jgi:hypothetical protein